MVNIPLIKAPISSGEFYRSYLIPNQPCVLDQWITSGWEARELWCHLDGTVNIQAVFKHIPDDQVLCVSDCSRLEFDAHVTMEMTVKEFTHYWDDLQPPLDTKLLYLKDWHYFRDNPGHYFTLPDLFASDWLNEFWRVRRDITNDYQFVYLGKNNTWTPLHSDVYRSYSWSANICGRKRWWFFPPGEEKKLSSMGAIPPDVRELELEHIGVDYCIIDQYPGQAVFVPSGWYHQVVNLTECLSINHNWFNAANVHHVWDHLQEQLRLVEESTKDVQDIPGWHQECQICLRALAGIDFFEFFLILKYILLTRWPSIVSSDEVRCEEVPGLQDLAKCDKLKSIDELVNAALLHCFEQTADDAVQILRQAESCTTLNMPPSDHNPGALSRWIRLHDFVNAIRIIREIIRHPVTAHVSMLPADPLRAFLFNL
ncbi:unnamed protein product [Dicrocoelium dendriticum]|nr:unnamed protein product [Dicrocoelium dendriticum]